MPKTDQQLRIRTAYGVQRHLPVNEFVKTAEMTAAKLQEVLRETPLHLPQKHQCLCGHSLKEARFKV